MDKNTHAVTTEEVSIPTKDELKINISANALRQVLDALVGPQHLIRELQVTRGLPGFLNPIDQLIDEFNVEVRRLNSCNEEKPMTSALDTSSSTQTEYVIHHSV